VRKIDIKDAAGLFNDIEHHVADHVLHLCAGDREVAVVVSPERYRGLLMKGVPENVEPRIVELFDESIKTHGAVYAALAKLD